MPSKKSDIEEIRLFVAELINEEQAAHSKLVNELRIRIGDTREFDDTLKILTQIYDAKVKLLEKIYKEMQRF